MPQQISQTEPTSALNAGKKANPFRCKWKDKPGDFLNLVEEILAEQGKPCDMSNAEDITLMSEIAYHACQFWEECYPSGWVPSERQAIERAIGLVAWRMR